MPQVEWSSPMTEELIGIVLGDGRYRIDVRIGSGGQGTVYRGTHLTLNMSIAIKVLPTYLAQNETTRTRFAREAQRAATLRHPNIVTVLDYAHDDERGLYYIVSEFIDGTDLQKLLKASNVPMPVDRALGYLRQIASALQYAHERNIVHRDIKPGNVLIDRQDDRAVLCDFGLARMIEGEDMEVTSERTGMPGTPTYMSPEQCLGQGLDHRTDIYSLGIVAYEMLAGRNPFRGPHDTSESIKYKQVNQPPPPPRTVNPAIDPVIEAALLKALAKDPVDRFQAASDFVRALEGRVAVEPPPLAFPEEDVTVLPPEPPEPEEVTVLPPEPRAAPRKRRPRKRKRRGVPALLMVTALALVGVVVFAVPEARYRAEELWGRVAGDLRTVSESSEYFEGLWDLLFGESAPRPTATASPTPRRPAGSATTPTGPGVAAQTGTARAVISARTKDAQTREAASATRDAQTKAPVSSSGTPEAPTGEVVIRIEGLFERELYCSTLVLYKGERSVRRIPLEGRREFRVPRRSVDWLRFEGSLDGKCPWTSWRLSNHDPNHIDITGDEIVLVFERAK